LLLLVGPVFLTAAERSCHSHCLLCSLRRTGKHRCSKFWNWK